MMDALEMGLERRAAALRARRRIQQVALPLLVALPVLFVWHLYTTALRNPLVPGPLSIAKVAPSVVGSPEVWSGLLSSDISLLLGFAAAAAVGIPLGLLAGRVSLVDHFLSPILDLALVTPMIVLMPIILVALGLTRQAQVAIIFIFSITVIVVPVRAGIRAIATEVVEMAESFGAGELALWREVLLPGAIPSIVTGLRLGFGQANLGMAAVELTMLSIGIGRVMLDYGATFQKAEQFAVVGIIVIQSILVMSVLRSIEGRVAPNSANPGVAEGLT
jgi:NitT/TauT family transport system permease protein